jgi:hypothetical protein
MSADDNEQLLAELENLLKKQIALARRGSFSGLDKMSDTGEQLVEKIKVLGLLARPEYTVKREHLTNLYRELRILLSTQQNDVFEQLKSVRKSKKTLSIYRGSI